MVFNRNEQKQQLVINRDTEKLRELYHLGSEISKDGRSISVIKSRTSLTKKPFLKNNFFLKSNIDMDFWKERLLSVAKIYV